MQQSQQYKYAEEVLIVGSTAILMQGYQGYRDYAQDLDVICTKNGFNDLVRFITNKGEVVKAMEFSKEIHPVFGKVAIVKFKSGKILDAHIVDDLQETVVGNDAYLLKSASLKWDRFGIDYVTDNEEYSDWKDFNCLVADASAVLQMKMSHRYKKDSPAFLKTMQDIRYLRDKMGVCAYSNWVKAREKLTLGSHPKLNVCKSEFFTDSVPYKYDHDSLHEAVKILDRPAYTYYMQDGADVMCDQYKWDKLPRWHKLIGVLEEASVLALERAIIPCNTPAQTALDIALEKVCTSITSGWFREFAWENYDTVQAMFDPDALMGMYRKGLSNATIKPFNKQG